MKLRSYSLLFQFGCAVVLAGENETSNWIPYLTSEELLAAKGLPIETNNFSISLPPDKVIGGLGHSTKASAGIFGNGLWTNAEVPYILDGSLNKYHRGEVAKAILQFHENTCIRFVPKENWHKSWVSIQMDWNAYTSNTCGWAHQCMRTGQTIATFGRNCQTARLMVHELGHTLCLGHEQQRNDRDDWIDWDRNKCEPHPKDSTNSLGLHKFYDYLSSQHYWTICANGCAISKEPGVTKCGSDTLSVLDIELLNEIYGCNSGCQGLRWVNHENNIDDAYVTSVDWDGVYLYTCRVYHNGDIIPGKYRKDQKACYIPYGGGEHRRTGKYIEVLTNPNGARLNYVHDTSPPSNAVKGGRSSEGDTIYLVSCLLRFDWGHLWVPGKWHWWAYASWEREHWCKDEYYFLVCD